MGEKGRESGRGRRWERGGGIEGEGGGWKRILGEKGQERGGGRRGARVEEREGEERDKREGEVEREGDGREVEGECGWCERGGGRGT